MKLLRNFLVILFYIGFVLPINLFAEELIGLPRTEGSKSFDMEINQLNNIGIKHYSLNELDRAEESLKKATILLLNLALELLQIIMLQLILKMYLKKYYFSLKNIKKLKKIFFL